jgi:Helix-turn-helix domain
MLQQSVACRSRYRFTLRLGARIFDLKQKGWDFRTEMREDKNTVYVVTKFRS